ncbi:MAG: hypothetical protein ACKO82_05810, partial [Acidimicrobiaceae bacterium]
MPESSDSTKSITEQIMQGLYLWKIAPAAKHRASILFSGSAHLAASAAAAELLERYDVGCE